MSEKFTEAGVWGENESSTTFAIPVSYQQLDEADISLNSLFDDDAGSGDGYGEIVVTCTNEVSDDGDVSQRYGVWVLQTTLQKPKPHWANAEYLFNDHAAGYKNRNAYARQQSKLKGLFDKLADSCDLSDQITENYEEWEEIAETLEDLEY